MVIQRVELCIVLLKLVVEFVVVFIEAVSTVVHDFNLQRTPLPSLAHMVPAPYVGILP